VLRSVKIPILPGQAPSVLFCLPFLGLYLPSALSQKAQPDENVPPKYDLHLEKKSEGVVEQANLLPLGTGKDFIELIINRGRPGSCLCVPQTTSRRAGYQFQQERRGCDRRFKS